MLTILIHELTLEILVYKYMQRNLQASTCIRAVSSEPSQSMEVDTV